MFKRKNWVNVRLRAHEAQPVEIVADAAVASKGIKEGKLIPLLILDTSKRPEIDELVRVHQHFPAGDARSQWCQLHGTKGKIALMMQFIRPSEITIVLEFDIKRQGFLVDQILASGFVFIQPGRPGDRFITTSNNPRISIQVPDSGIGNEWERIYRKGIVEHFKSRGLRRNQAKRAAIMFLEETRNFGKFRMP